VTVVTSYVLRVAGVTKDTPDPPGGAFAPGKLADFVVLRADPRKVPAREIKDIVIDSTWIGGKAMFTAGSTEK
jgi:hypothetical protein